MSLGYHAEKDIPDLSGKVFRLTGGTGGLGKSALLQLMKHNPKHIYFTGRNAKAAEAVIAEAEAASTSVSFIPCDMTSLSSVSVAAKTFLEKSGNQLDVLICNAGIMAVPPATSKDGYEIQFAVNHLAHALLVKLCLPVLQKVAEEKGDARVVSVSSLAFRSAPKDGIIIKDLKTNQKNLELAKHYPKITSTAVHPGVIRSGLFDHIGWLDRAVLKLATLQMKHFDLQEGAYNTLWAATTADMKGLSGGIYEPVGIPVSPTKQSADKMLADELWKWTEKELANYS